jgi:hypothetical protein
VILVVDPAGAEGQFFGKVLVVFIAEAVGANEGAGFGVANVLHLMHSRGSAQEHTRRFSECGAYQASLRPMRRALRIVRIIVDIVARCGQWLGGRRSPGLVCLKKMENGHPIESCLEKLGCGGPL